MKTRHKMAIGGLAVTLIAACAFGVAAYRHVTRTIPDCYAQWAAAELVVGFRKEKGAMPATWADLRPYYGVAALHHGGLSFEEIEKRIRIDFPALHTLEMEYSDDRIPEVVVTKSGIGAYWDGADPNRLINHETRKRK